MQFCWYNVLNNVLFLNNKLHTFGIKPSPLLPFYNLYDETSYHMFYECDRVKCLWSDLVQCFQNNLILPTLTPQTAIFGFLDYTNNDSIFENNKCLSNHILLIFKLYVYISRVFSGALKYKQSHSWNSKNLTTEKEIAFLIQRKQLLLQGNAT